MKASRVGIWLVVECLLVLTQNIEAFTNVGGYHRQIHTDASTTSVASDQFDVDDQGGGGGARVCVLDSDIGDGAAADLASRLSLPLVMSSHDGQSLSAADLEGYTHVLTTLPYECYGVRDYSIAISMFLEDKNRSSRRRKTLSKRKLANPFFVDFCPAETSLLAMRSSGDTGPDLLLKAVSPRKGFPRGATVYDLTAGWGQDALLIAKAGARSVHMVEQNPIVSCLLWDALRRLTLLAESSTDKSIQEVASNLSECLALTQGDGSTVARQLADLENEDARPDIVYLDPMFPERKKKASVKKNMQILHGLSSSQEISVSERLEQEEKLLRAAFAAAKSRVVVKRPRNAPLLGERVPGDSPIPSSSICGSVNRWDVYAKL